MPSAIEQKYASLNDPQKQALGTSTGSESSCTDGQGRFRNYQKGAIYWHPDTGAHVVVGLIFKKWAALGREGSSLGYPRSDESATTGGRYNVFQHGVALWKSGTQEAFEVRGAIATRFALLSSEHGALGFPVTDEKKTPDGAGRYNHFEHGSIYWHPDTGAHEVRGLISKKWADLGFEKSPLGFPTTGEVSGPSGAYSRFQHGAIYWKSDSTSAFAVYGAIYERFRDFGAELGYPTTDETKTPDGVGRYNHFERGSVYWKPNLGAHAVYGPIHTYWAAHGWEHAPGLGYPIGNVTKARAGSKNLFCDFENGVLYWRASTDTVSPASHDNEFFVELFANAEASILASVRQELLSASDKLSIKSGPQTTAIVDYSYAHGRVANRKFHVEVQLNVELPSILLKDATVDLWMNIELWYDQSSKKLGTTLHSFHVHAYVPAISSAFISAQELADQFASPLAARQNVAEPLPDAQQLPPGAWVLSLKTIPDHSIRIYVPPTA